MDRGIKYSCSIQSIKFCYSILPCPGLLQGYQLKPGFFVWNNRVSSYCMYEYNGNYFQLEKNGIFNIKVRSYFCLMSFVCYAFGPLLLVIWVSTWAMPSGTFTPNTFHHWLWERSPSQHSPPPTSTYSHILVLRNTHEDFQKKEHNWRKIKM